MEPISTTNVGLPKTIGFFLGFRIILLVLGVRLLGLDPQTTVALTLSINFLCLLSVALLPASEFGARDVLRQPPVRWAVLFLAFTGASLVWTIAVSTPAAAAYWCAMVADALMVLLILRQGPPFTQATAIMRGFVAGACTVAAISWLLPSQSDLRLGDEELLGPNQLGFLFAFAFFFALFLIREANGKYKSAAAFLLITLLRTLSKTSIIATACALAWLLIRDRAVGRRTKLGLTLLALIVLVLFSSLLSAYIDVYLNLGNQSLTLSGRLSVWAYVLNEAVERPWIGHGFHSMWKVIPPMNGSFEPRHAHNELLQQFYAYGVAGIFLLIGIYGSFWRRISKLRSRSLSTFLHSVMIFILVRGLTDTEVFDLSMPMWAIILWSILMQDIDTSYTPQASSRDTVSTLGADTVLIEQNESILEA